MKLGKGKGLDTFLQTGYCKWKLENVLSRFTRHVQPLKWCVRLNGLPLIRDQHPFGRQPTKMETIICQSLPPTRVRVSNDNFLYDQRLQHLWMPEYRMPMQKREMSLKI